MTTVLAAVLATAVPPVRDGASSIEGAFLAAGDGLGRGLLSFDALERRLSALTTELSDAAMAEAVRALGEVAQRLVAISAALPADRATLAELVGCNRAVEERLQGLMAKMRMMFTLARTARIEAASVDRAGIDFGPFTLEIMALTRTMQDDLGLSARGQVRLAGLLQAALQMQAALDHEHRLQLVDLAAELTQAIAILRQRQTAGAAILGELSVRSKRMGDAVRTAIMALQMGDTARQRLEHVDEGLAIAREHAAGGPDGETAARHLAGLLGALLADAVGDYGAEADQIDRAFEALLGEAHDLVELGRGSDRGGDGEGADTALDAVQQRVTRAALHIAECETARTAVDGTIGRLREQLADVDGAVQKLGTVTADIVLIGVNAGLRAARLGQEGRSLVVVAGELKALATGITDDAKALLGLLARLGEISARLHTGDAAREPGALERAMTSVLDGLRESADRVSGALRDIDRTGGSFRKDLSGVRARFAKASAFNTRLGEVADDLDAAAALDAPFGPPPPVRALLEAAMTGRYTMARERQVHEAILGALPPDPAEAEDDERRAA